MFSCPGRAFVSKRRRRRRHRRRLWRHTNSSHTRLASLLCVHDAQAHAERTRTRTHHGQKQRSRTTGQHAAAVGADCVRLIRADCQRSCLCHGRLAIGAERRPRPRHGCDHHNRRVHISGRTFRDARRQGLRRPRPTQVVPPRCHPVHHGLCAHRHDRPPLITPAGSRQGGDAGDRLVVCGLQLRLPPRQRRLHGMLTLLPQGPRGHRRLPQGGARLRRRAVGASVGARLPRRPRARDVPRLHSVLRPRQHAPLPDRHPGP